MRWLLIILLFSCTPSKKVYLIGEGHSPENSPLTFSWRQIKGGQVQIKDRNQKTTTTDIKKGMYAWELTIRDAKGFTFKDTAYLKY